MMVDNGTLVIYDEAESAAATQAQMAQTARRYGLGGFGDGVTEVGGPRLEMRPPQIVADAAYPPAPMHIGNSAMQAQPAQQLLLTPSSREGYVRLVRMQDGAKTHSWTLLAELAGVLVDVLRTLGVNPTDLREEDA